MDLKLGQFRDLMLRVTLGIVFLWFGMDKFLNPSYWSMWVPEPLHVAIGSLLKAEALQGLIYGVGIFEVLIGGALVLGILTKYAASLAAAFLLLIIVASGVSPVVRDIGLFGLAFYLATIREDRPVWRPSLAVLKKIVFVAVMAAVVVVPLVSLTKAGNQSLEPIAASDSLQTITEGPPSPLKGPLIFLSPTNGQTVQARRLEVEIQVLVDTKKLAVSHVHLRLDGRMVDVIYLGPQSREIYSVLEGIAPGEHTLSASLAYIDHTELRGYKASVFFIIKST